MRAMFLTRVECSGFRCLDEVVFSPIPGINVVRGGNAQGKTTLLEAVLFAATARSHRTNNEQDLVRHGAEGFSVLAAAERRERRVSLEAIWWQGVKRFRVNGVAQTRTSDILGRINLVFFSPEDVDLVKGGAAGRRRFLDMELSQLEAAYLAALQQYRQVLRQRNEVLRGATPDEDLLAVWEAQLAQYGAQIIRHRAAFVAQLAGHAATAYACIAGGEAFGLAYRPDVAEPESLADVLARTRSSDIRRKMTQRGPHRDDFEITVADRLARTYASQGQQKTAALALKLAEVHAVTDQAGDPPVLMLDEVLAELDDGRAQHLLDAVPESVQCVLTTTSAEGGNEGRLGGAANFRMEQGHLEAI